MKKTIIFTVLALTGAFCFGCTQPTSVAKAADAFELFGEDFIKLYEEEVAKTQVVSQLSDDELSAKAAELGISVDKLRKVLVLQHAFASADNNYTEQQILQMKTGEIIKNTRALFKHLKKTMPASEYKQVDAKFKEMLRAALKNK